MIIMQDTLGMRCIVFGISYYDKNYNFSPVKVFDLSGTTGNKASSGIDYKFPKRTDSDGLGSNYAILRTGTNNGVDYYSVADNIGIELTDIDNHPTWAKGFVIVRAKRRKNIQFQTPLIPNVAIKQTQLVGNYPTQGIDKDGTSTVDFTGAQPASPEGTLIPKNYFLISPRDTGLSTENDALSEEGEVKLMSTNNFAVTSHTIVVPSHIYGQGGYSYIQGDKIAVIDAALLNLDEEVYSSDPSLPTAGGNAELGNYKETAVHGTFYANSIDDYYVDYRRAVTPVLRTNGLTAQIEWDIDGYAEVDNYGEGTLISGGGGLAVSTDNFDSTTNTYGGYSGLQPTVLTEGITPNNNRLSVISISASPIPPFGSLRIEDATANCASANDGNGMRNDNVFQSGKSVNTAFNVGRPNTNDFVNTYGAYSKGDVVGATFIANMVRGLGDDRYGEADDEHEFISTGTTYAFSDAELVDVEAGNSLPIDVDVWGGDCKITPHSIKITDGHYGISDVDKFNAAANTDAADDDATKWGYSF